MSKNLAISRVVAENFLSLQKIDIKLMPLTVLVGPNGSGKSNILKIFQFLGNVARRDLIPAITSLGGFENLFFRGQHEKKDRVIRISLVGTVTQHSSQNAPDEYSLSFWQQSYVNVHANTTRRLLRRSEKIVLKRTAGKGRRITLTGNSVRVQVMGSGGRRAPEPLSVQGDSAGLATLRRLGEEYGADQIEALAQVFEQLRLFEIDVERVKRPASLSNPKSLMPDGSNLAAFLHWLHENHEDAFNRVSDDVRFVLPNFERFEFVRLGGPDEYVRVDLIERHLAGATPLARASFGTIRSIALFAMLHDPNPPRLTCLEEVDHGLHPHALDRLVDRLREASQHTQFILATHSPALVNRLRPDELLIVERNLDTAATQAIALRAADIEELQKNTDYGLGELWFSGVLGGGL